LFPVFQAAHAKGKFPRYEIVLSRMISGHKSQGLLQTRDKPGAAAAAALFRAEVRR